LRALLFIKGIAGPATFAPDKALRTKALPVSVWQLVQWQQWTNIGASVSR
jgi:hypothetical protein